MKTLTIAAIAAMLLAGAVQALAANQQPPKAKPSSYAPGPKAKDGVYGTPIGTPIVGQSRGRHHHGQKKQSTAHAKHKASGKAAAGAKKSDSAKVPK